MFLQSVSAMFLLSLSLSFIPKRDLEEMSLSSLADKMIII